MHGTQPPPEHVLVLIVQTYLQIMAAMYRHADDGTRESVKKVLMRAVDNVETEMDAWVDNILGDRRPCSTMPARNAAM